jgi:hypothetical protein
MGVRFELKKKEDSTGQLIDTLTKITEKDGKTTEEDWGTVQDFDRLFNTCVAKWGSNWDLEKILVAIRESSIK